MTEIRQLSDLKKFGQIMGFFVELLLKRFNRDVDE